MDRRLAVRRALLEGFLSHGWRRIRVVPRAPGTWRVEESWEIESLWSPQGLRVYLVFLNPDPDRWVTGGIAISDEEPGLAWDYYWRPTWYVGRGWRRDLPAFFATLARWRDANAHRAPPPPDPEPESKPELNVDTWQTCTDAEALLYHLRVHQLRGRLSDRKLRLLTCACLRHLWHVIEDVRNLRAVEAAEQYADGLVAKRELKKARKAANMPWLSSFEPYDEAVSTVIAAKRVTTPEQQRVLCDLLREVVGDPFRPVVLKPSWLSRNGGIAATMARTIYEERRFDELPILADALEEAGCDNADLLAHCRSAGEHVRGCWALDLLLGRE